MLSMDTENPDNGFMQEQNGKLSFYNQEYKKSSHSWFWWQ